VRTVCKIGSQRCAAYRDKMAISRRRRPLLQFFRNSLQLNKWRSDVWLLRSVLFAWSAISNIRLLRYVQLSTSRRRPPERRLNAQLTAVAMLAVWPWRGACGRPADDGQKSGLAVAVYWLLVVVSVVFAYVDRQTIFNKINHSTLYNVERI